MRPAIRPQHRVDPKQLNQCGVDQAHLIQRIGLKNATFHLLTGKIHPATYLEQRISQLALEARFERYVLPEILNKTVNSYWCLNLLRGMLGQRMKRDMQKADQ